MNVAAQELMYMVLAILGFGSCAVFGVGFLEKSIPIPIRLFFAAALGVGIVMGLGCTAMMVLWGLVDIGWIRR